MVTTVNKLTLALASSAAMCVSACTRVCLHNRCRLHYHDKEATRLKWYPVGSKGVLENGRQQRSRKTKTFFYVMQSGERFC